MNSIKKFKVYFIQNENKISPYQNMRDAITSLQEAFTEYINYSGIEESMI